MTRNSRQRMPLVRIDNIGDGVRLALWRMTEDVEDLPCPPGGDLSGTHSDVRRKERLVSYCMLRSLTGKDGLLITHLPSGKPVVDGFSISLSHTKGWAAMIISPKPMRLGVDIEYYSERVNKVADRFIRPDEQSDSLAYRLINWSAKESVYKALSSEDLHFFEMRLKPFAASPRGEVVVEDLKVSREMHVGFVLNKDFVLTWVKEK